MTRTVTPRLISPTEVAVIRAALERAPRALSPARLLPPIEELRVVGRCKCGCDSVDFIPVEMERSRPIAEAIATTPSGGTVGVIVWGTNESVTGLEVYDLGAGDGDLRLPTPESIRPWASIELPGDH
jgi:hypothetical protein